ncbi:MAG: hypothetical protein IPL53_21300 [Ignavibacteria bacterium]|nr:hypothetical protein [Ignavibacteria bacterium]
MKDLTNRRNKLIYEIPRLEKETERLKETLMNIDSVFIKDQLDMDKKSFIDVISKLESEERQPSPDTLALETYVKILHIMLII